MYVVAEPEFQDSASFIFSVRVFSVLQWCALSMVDLSFKMIVMHGWNRSQEKISAILKHYACTGVYLRSMYLYLSTFESTCNLLKSFSQKRLCTCTCT